MTWSTGITTAPRLFLTGPLTAGQEIHASPEHTHYVGTVLRCAPGEIVRVFNGTDGEWTARVDVPPVVGRSPRAARQMTFRVEEQLRPQTPESGPWLLFGLLKRDATDLVVRQAVELGASRIMPVIMERTNAARVNEDRLRAIAIEAAEQSERLTIPDIDPLQRLDSALSAWPAERHLFTAFERTGAPPVHASPNIMALLIGPEGGITPAEREFLHRLSFTSPLSLGPFVLRAETAAAAGLALLLAIGSGEYVRST